MSALSTKTVKELQALCKEKGIKGYSGKSKADLLTLLTPPPEPIKEESVPILIEKTKPKKEKKPKEPKESKETKETKEKVPTKQETKSKIKARELKSVKDQQTVNKSNSAYPLSLSLQTPLTHILGFESAATQLIEWLKGPPTSAGLYGASGIGKSYFVEEFAKAINYTLLHIPYNTDTLDTPLLQNRTLHFPRIFAVCDDAEKIQKTPKNLQTHLLYVGRDKFAPTYLTGPLIQVRRPTALQIAKFLHIQYSSYTIQELQELAEQNKADIRHILKILESTVSQNKDETIDQDAFQAHIKLYDRDMSFEKRTQFAETDPDMIFCLAQESVPRISPFVSKEFIKAMDVASLADCIHTQAHRVALTTSIPAYLPPTVKPPFVSFPMYYGKYSKGQKHKTYLSQLHARKHDLESVPVLRAKLFEKANELAESGFTNEQIASAVLKTIQREHMTYDLLFDSYEDCCYEGSELEEFDTPIQKEIQRQAKLLYAS